MDTGKVRCVFCLEPMDEAANNKGCPRLYHEFDTLAHARFYGFTCIIEIGSIENWLRNVNAAMLFSIYTEEKDGDRYVCKFQTA